MRLLPRKAVVDRTGIGLRTMYKLIEVGKFPHPVQLSARRVGWVEDEVEAWMAEKVAKRDKYNEMR